jgi:hypothetical protein
MVCRADAAHAGTFHLAGDYDRRAGSIQHKGGTRPKSGDFQMTKTAIAALSAALLTASLGMASAATSSMSSKMSKSNMAMMQRCEGMSASAMKRNKKCMAMMKAHPDMMKSGGSMGTSGSMSGGGM